MTQRQELHQLPREDIELFWKQLEASDWNDHPECGFVPTGEFCPACKKTLAPSLPHPYSYQDDYLRDTHLTSLLAGGEQSGKSISGAMKFLQTILAFLGEYQGRAAGEVAWLVANSYELTSREFGYIKDWLERVSKLKTSIAVDPGHIIIRVPGGVFTIKTRSADNAQTLRAESPIVTLVCEAALLSFDAYERLSSRVARSRALFPGYGAIFLTSTFEGSIGWYPALYLKWQSEATQKKENVGVFSLPAGSNIFVYKGGMEDPQILDQQGKLGENEFRERFLAIPSPPSGRVHMRFDPTIHVLDVEYEPDEPILIGVDPGWSGVTSSYAIEVFQKRRLPCENVHYAGIFEVFKWRVLAEKIVLSLVNEPWWKNPAKHVVMDVAGGQQTGVSVDTHATIWLKTHGIMPLRQPIRVLDGLNRFDALLNICAHPSCGQPVLTVNPNQKALIAENGGGPHPHDGKVHVYQWPLDTKEQNPKGRIPLDQYNDATKATAYLFMSLLGPTNIRSGRTSFKQTRHKVKALAGSIFN